MSRYEKFPSKVTPGPWLQWTSNSHWRLGTQRADGSVLHAYLATDGHLCINCKPADGDLIEAACNACLAYPDPQRVADHLPGILRYAKEVTRRLAKNDIAGLKFDAMRLAEMVDRAGLKTVDWWQKDVPQVITEGKGDE